MWMRAASLFFFFFPPGELFPRDVCNNCMLLGNMFLGCGGGGRGEFSGNRPGNSLGRNNYPDFGLFRTAAILIGRIEARTLLFILFHSFAGPFCLGGNLGLVWWGVFVEGEGVRFWRGFGMEGVRFWKKRWPEFASRRLKKMMRRKKGAYAARCGIDFFLFVGVNLEF